MTTAIRTARPAQVGYRNHTIIGTPAHIANVLANYTRAGTLLTVSAPQAAIDPADPRVRVRILVRDTAPAAPLPVTLSVPPRISRRTRRIAVLAVTIASAVAGVLAVVAYLVGLLVAFIAAHAAQILVVLILIAVVLGLIVKALSGGKRHCPGC